jgi:hypothetical protein
MLLPFAVVVVVVVVNVDVDAVVEFPSFSLQILFHPLFAFQLLMQNNYYFACTCQ